MNDLAIEDRHTFEITIGPKRGVDGKPKHKKTTKLPPLLSKIVSGIFGLIVVTASIAFILILIFPPLANIGYNLATTADCSYSNTMTSDIEQRVFLKTNEQRQLNDLPSLRWSNELADLARTHSADMAERGFFDHVNPDGDGPTQRAKKMGLSTTVKRGPLTYLGVGENILLEPAQLDWVSYAVVGKIEDVIATEMVDGWMNSFGHRQNILDPSYSTLGVGVSQTICGGTYYATQNFK